jgi:hypothetical protein
MTSRNNTKSLQLVEDSMNRIVSMTPTRSKEDQLVAEWTALRHVVDDVVGAELGDLVEDGTLNLDVLRGGHWSAVELIYWLATLIRPTIWNAVARTPSFAKIALMCTHEI